MSAKFLVEPFTENCYEVYQKKEHVVFGVSPGNSYFRVPLLTDLLGWLCGEFSVVDVVIPDSPLVHTYVAMGYDPERAERKARGEINVLRNRVNRAWQAQGGPRPADGLHMMSDLAANTTYQRLLGHCEQLVSEDGQLRDTCLAMSRDVLAARSPGYAPTPEQVQRSARYLIEELPFFLASVDIFDMSSSLCFYHQRLPLADLIFSGKCALRAAPHQGHAIVRPAQPTAP